MAYASPWVGAKGVQGPGFSWMRGWRGVTSRVPATPHSLVLEGPPWVTGSHGQLAWGWSRGGQSDRR